MGFEATNDAWSGRALIHVAENRSKSKMSSQDDSARTNQTYVAVLSYGRIQLNSRALGNMVTYLAYHWVIARLNPIDTYHRMLVMLTTKSDLSTTTLTLCRDVRVRVGVIGICAFSVTSYKGFLNLP